MLGLANLSGTWEPMWSGPQRERSERQSVGEERKGQERKGKAKERERRVSDGSGDGGGHHTRHASLLQPSACDPSFLPSFPRSHPWSGRDLFHWPPRPLLMMPMHDSQDLYGPLLPAAPVWAHWLSRESVTVSQCEDPPLFSQPIWAPERSWVPYPEWLGWLDPDSVWKKFTNIVADSSASCNSFSAELLRKVGSEEIISVILLVSWHCIRGGLGRVIYWGKRISVRRCALSVRSFQCWWCYTGEMDQ